MLNSQAAFAAGAEAEADAYAEQRVHEQTMSFLRCVFTYFLAPSQHVEGLCSFVYNTNVIRT